MSRCLSTGHSGHAFAIIPVILEEIGEGIGGGRGRQKGNENEEDIRGKER